MRPSGTCRLLPATAFAALFVVGLAGLAGVGCGGRTLATDAGGGQGGGTPPANVDPMDLISDFEEGKAIVLPLGTPTRSGSWYSYNDAAATCLQSPAHGSEYYGSTSAVPPPGPSRGRALHASWNACATWGAGVGADFNGPGGDGGVSPQRMPYDLTDFAGIAFWAMAEPGTETTIRAKVVMRASTDVQDHGTCVETAPDQCGDEWGEPFTLPADGTWKAVVVRFSDAAFKQEDWGLKFAWNPADVLGVQFQSAASGGLYDFWIDDIYLLR